MDAEGNLVLKCRKCRKELVDSRETPILSGHEVKVSADCLYRPSPDSDCRDTLDSLYLTDLGLPSWILSTLNEESWEKGKIKCPHCSARLGSFDFVSGRKCQCAKFVLPPIHISRSKIDHELILHNEK